MRARRFGIICFAAIVLAANMASAAPYDLRLIDASEHDDVPAAKALVAAGVDVNARSGDGSTALHWAAQNNDLAMAELLIHKGAKVNAATDLGVTPLWVAASNSGTAMVERLLQAHANPNIAPQTGHTALMMLSKQGNAQAVKALLDHGANPNTTEAANGQTALMWAASARHPEVVKLLLKAHADVRARAKSWSQRMVLCCQLYGGDHENEAVIVMGGYTPLLFTAQYGDVESAKLLLAAGADVKDTAPDGESAVVIAAQVGQSDVGVFLLDAGADANASGAGYSALHIAAARGDVVLAQALLAHGANPNARATKGTPTKRVRSGHEVDQRMLGATPFILAAGSGNLEVMTVLAAKGADPSIPTQDGRTALMVVAGEATTEGPDIRDAVAAQSIKLAVQLGTPVNQALPQVGDTALHVAATWRRDAVVQALVDSGANINARNQAGQTPLTAALTPPGAQKGTVASDDYESLLHHTQTAELLRKLGGKT